MTRPAPDGWELPRPVERVRATGFALLVLVGLGLLWSVAPVIGLLESGHCGPPTTTSECERLWAAAGTHARVYFAIAVMTTVVGVLAILRGGRVLPAILLVTAMVTLALAWASVALPATTGVSGPLPNAMITVVPGAVMLAIAALWQLARFRRGDGTTE